MMRTRTSRSSNAKRQQQEAERAAQLAEQQRQLQLQAQQEAQAQRQRQLAADQAAQLAALKASAAKQKQQQQQRAEQLKQQQLRRAAKTGTTQGSAGRPAEAGAGRCPEESGRAGREGESPGAGRCASEEDGSGTPCPSRATARYGGRRSSTGTGLAKSGDGSGSGGTATSPGYATKCGRRVQPNVSWGGDTAGPRNRNFGALLAYHRHFIERGDHPQQRQRPMGRRRAAGCSEVRSQCRSTRTAKHRRVSRSHCVRQADGRLQRRPEPCARERIRRFGVCQLS